MATNDEMKTAAANTDSYHPEGLRMDENRTRRFCRALSRMARSIHSLEVAGISMEGEFDVAAGRTDPGATIRAFSATMSQDIDLVFQMLANEEAAESDASKGGA